MIKKFENFNEDSKMDVFIHIESTKQEAILIKAPGKKSELNYPTIFTAGSIEMGKAIDWQSKVFEFFKDKKVIIYNPRRDDWDNSWKQTIKDDKFREQVEWELNLLDSVDFIIMYIDPKTTSPISLLELGLHARSKKLYVCCPEGFYRKGNVDITCIKYGIPMFDTLEELLNAIYIKIKSL